MAITYALMQRLEELSEREPDRVQIVKRARVTNVNKEGNFISGVTYESNGESTTVDGVVVLATGGYAADFGNQSLLQNHRPDTFGLSSTNGAHATGDGQKMLMEIGANGIDMDKVQVHPTGLVDPKDPQAKFKFLAAEALRGEGGLLLNGDGERFADELGHRDYVSAEMWKEKEKNKWPVRLILNSKASNVLDFHTRHYAGRGLMRKMTGEELAKEIGCGSQKLQKTFSDYNAIAEGKQKDPWGKRFFHNLPFNVDDEFHVALMEPVLHFTMGGIEINEHAQVLNADHEPFEGLYACGELAGGVHGANRLGGSSLLGCVVYGRVAGDSSSQHLFRKLISGGATPAQNRLGQVSLHIDPATPGKISVEWNGAGGNSGGGGVAAGASPVNNAAAAQQPPKPTGPKEFSVPEKEYTMEEVSKHNKKDDLWIVVKGCVLDVTNWLDEHPGGANALFNFMGRDATEGKSSLRIIIKYLEIVLTRDYRIRHAARRRSRPQVRGAYRHRPGPGPDPQSGNLTIINITNTPPPFFIYIYDSSWLVISFFFFFFLAGGRCRSAF